MDVAYIGVGDLEGSTSTARGGKWNAMVTITVHEVHGEVETPVAVDTATLSGSWSAGASGSESCVMDGAGQCNITKNNIHKNSSSVTNVERG